jgi:hypothetical protein
VTLRGAASSPREGLAYRWVQLDGPSVVAVQQERASYSFIPSAAGQYRFGLLVAGGGSISEPDEVTVLVGTAPMAPAVTGPPAAPASPSMPVPVPMSAPASMAVPPVPPEQVLAAALPRLADGPAIAMQAAEVFESIAARAELYPSLAEMQAELRGRLDGVIPSEPQARQAWMQSVFQPLTDYTAAQLATTGIDLRWPQGLAQPPTAIQRRGIRETFLNLARAFRTASAPGRAGR